MTSTKQNSPDFSYVDAILQDFLKEDTSSGFRAKAIAVMCILIARSGGFNKPTNLTAQNIADMLNISGTALYEAFDLLIKANMIYREPTQGRGNRLVITPLSPEKWKLPSGKNYSNAGVSRKLITHDAPPNNRNLVDVKCDNKVHTNIMQDIWSPIFKKINLYVETSKTLKSDDPNKLTSTDPAKLYGVMTIVVQYTEIPGGPCSLSQKEVGELITQNVASIGKTMKKLEEMGVLKRVRGHRKNIITPIIPDSIDLH